MDIFPQTIQKKISHQSNDYSKLQKEDLSIDGISVIIPVFNQSEELFWCVKGLANQICDYPFEIVIIDDGSNESKIPLDKIHSISPQLDLTVLRLEKNCGAAAARNIGINAAKYSLLFFLDSDMMVPPTLLRDHLRVQGNFGKVLTIGFREHILLEEWKRRGKPYTKADHKKDFRYKKYIPESWASDHTRIEGSFEKVYKPLRESGDLKDFGYGRRIGVWTLPHMVLTASLAVRKDALIQVGGFDDRFEGVWYEDTFIGAKLIADGLYVLPVTSSSGYHIIHEKTNMNPQKARSALMNRKLYEKLICDTLVKIDLKTFSFNINKKYGKIIKKISPN